VNFCIAAHTGHSAMTRMAGDAKFTDDRGMRRRMKSGSSSILGVHLGLNGNANICWHLRYPVVQIDRAAGDLITDPGSWWCTAESICGAALGRARMVVALEMPSSTTPPNWA